MWGRGAQSLSLSHDHTHIHTHTHHNHIYRHTYTHTHMHKTQNGKMLGAAISGLCVLLQGNSGPALDNLLKSGQALAGALTKPSSYGVGPAVPPVP